VLSFAGRNFLGDSLTKAIVMDYSIKKDRVKTNGVSFALMGHPLH
jgi:hypothetical protein